MSIAIDVNHPPISAPLAAAGRSFLAGFVVNILWSGSTAHPTKALAGGVLSAAASLIDTAIRPILAQLFQGRDTELFQSLCRFVVVFSLLGAAATAWAPSLIGTTLSINLAASMVSALALAILTGIDVNYPVLLN